MINIQTPTGNILILNGEKGKLECLSVGDYGKEKNIKADFLGLTDDVNEVPHGDIMPLTEKWVVTISSQYGCSMGCTFCDVPKVGPGLNASYDDLKLQVIESLKLHPEIRATKRLNVHFARMGEPTFNRDVLDFTRDLRKITRKYIGRSLVHPVVSTMCPMNNTKLSEYLNEWIDIKNDLYRGDAGLQLSINTTDDGARESMFGGSAMTLDEISKLDLVAPRGRKYALNFALMPGAEINAEKLRDLFSPDKYMCKITPIHITASVKKNGLIDSESEKAYINYEPYRHYEESLKKAGFDVLVFVPSIVEDKSRITCGNAILAHEEVE